METINREPDSEVSVLGTNYKIYKEVNEIENPKLADAYGVCEVFSKRIFLASIETDAMTVENLDAFKRKIMRHEIIHAYFAESGLDNQDYSDNEQLVDWLAVQIPKMVDTFLELGVLR